MKETFSIVSALESTQQSAGFVLAIVLRTLEHTYQKAGAVALLGRDGDVRGMVSGGCLEGELLSRVEMLSPETLNWTHLRYDTRNEEDDLLGSALGCRGLLDLALVSIPQAERGGVKVFQSCLERSWSALSLSRAAFQIEAGDRPSLRIHMVGGAPDAVVSDPEVRIPWGGTVTFDAPDLARVLAEQPALLQKRKRVLICGAGPDVPPLLTVLAELGLEILVADHRPLALERLESLSGVGPSGNAHATVFTRGRQLKFLSAQELLSTLTDRGPFDACLIMSHHLEWDSRYIDALQSVDLGFTYVGLLGPTRRRRELFDSLAPHHPLDTDQLKSPMGLALGGRGAAEVAVSVAADLIAFWSERDARQRRAREDIS